VAEKEGYHKFLVDFKMFAQTEEGEYLPQLPVKPIFDDAYVTGILKSYVAEQQTKDAEVAKQMPRVIERITDEIIKPEGVQYSKRIFSKKDYAKVHNYEEASKVLYDALGVRNSKKLQEVQKELLKMNN